jgi:hypothetical protein
VTYATSFVLTTIEGDFGATTTSATDIWRTTFKIPAGVSGDYSPTNLLAYATAIAPATTTFFQAANGKTGATTYLKSIGVALVGTNGTYVGGGTQPTTRYTYPSALAGTGALTQPFSAALCLTFFTTKLRGRASRGRMYWPATGQVLQSGTGLIGPSAATGRVAEAQTWLNSVNATAATRFGAGSNVSVMSNLGTGTTAPVVIIGVGQKMDAQERRENKLKESYSVAPLTVSTSLLAERDAALRDIYRRQLEEEQNQPA